MTDSLLSALFQDYTDHVNPQWVRLLDLLQMNTQYTRCEGVELTTADGRVILDYLSGYCVHNAGHNPVYDSLKRSIVHTSTFSENSMSMRAGLATLDVLERENLGERALVMGDILRQRLREALRGYEMVREIRGMGMLSGIEFQAPKRLRLRAPFEAFRHIHAGMFGQIVVMRLFNDHRILTQVCGNNFMVLKVAPPLVVSEEQIERFVDAARDVVELMHNSASFWTDALGMARRAMNV